jgi:hypothetical protein
MTTEYKDILRLEGVEATIEAATLRNKQVGFSTDGQHRMVRKNASGDPDYWTADGYNVTYGDITVGEYIYHDGDADTYVRLTNNAFNITAGGKTWISSSETGMLILDEEVNIGEYTMPYTGGQINQVLGVGSGGDVQWIDQSGGGGGITGNSVIGLTQYGGVAINLANASWTGSGSGLLIGEMVKAAYALDSSYSITISEAGSNLPIGAVLDSSIAYATCGFVVTHGRAQLLFDTNGATKGYGFKMSSIEDGKAECVAPNAIDWKNMGSVLEDAGGGALAWCIIT